MKRTTVFMDEALDHDLHSLAGRKGVPVSQLIREALGHYLEEQSGREGFKLRFLAAGRSGRRDIAKRHENLLWRDLDPHGAQTAGKRERKR
jgi:predicted DNA-binding protein